MTTKDPTDIKLVEVMQYTNKASGVFWRTLNNGALFLKGDELDRTIKAGWAMVDFWMHMYV